MKRKLSLVLSCLLIMALVLSMAACGGSSDPAGKVVEQMFDAFEKEDAKLFKKCFDKDAIEELEQYMDDDALEEMLAEAASTMEDDYGKSWRKKVSIIDVEKDKDNSDDDVTYYIVTVELKGEDEDEEEITVKKVKGKYYIDTDSLGGIL